MKLFTLDSAYQVELNKEWIMLIPEFATLLRRDKGSAGDYRGDKKLKARKELTFIYFDVDFTSPIRDWEEIERRAEALRYAGLEEKDVDSAVMDAHKLYAKLQYEKSRSLKTLEALGKAMDALDKHYESIDFTLKDNKGALLHDPNSFILSMDRLNKAYDALDKFKRRVEEDLKGTSGIRGKATLGRNEGKIREWKENPVRPDTATADFRSIGQMIATVSDKFRDDSDVAEETGEEEVEDGLS